MGQGVSVVGIGTASARSRTEPRPRPRRCRSRAGGRINARLGLSRRALAEKFDVSQGQVMQALKLLELPVVVQESINAGDIPPTIGYEIAKVPRPGQAGFRRGTA